MALLVKPDRLVALDPLAAAKPRQDLRFLMLEFGWDDPRDGLAVHLLRGIAEQPLRPFVPGEDDALGGFANDTVFGGVNYGCQMDASAFRLAQIGHPVI